ncbi:MAG: T9SS type A sorting domain-containing protein [Raineya sp.]|nr:T9SS type A sorting domain-containing protein [Raineya sp.]
MKRTLKQMRNALTALLCSVSMSYAQTNFIPNPSFENLTSCPTNQGDVSKLSNWSLGLNFQCNSANNTPDILASCAPVVYPSNNQDISVPVNFQTRGLLSNNINGLMPHEGSNYVHLKYGGAPESIKTKFTSTLALGRQYRIRVWASLTVPENTTVNTPFNPNSGVQIRLRNTAPGWINSCQRALTVPLTGTFTTRGQWTLFEATFRVSDLMTNANMFDDPDNNIYYNFKDSLEIMPKFMGQGVMGEGILIDDMSLVEIPCNLNPAYGLTLSCDKTTREAVISVTGNVVNQNSQWNLYEMNGNSIADQDIVGGPTSILQQSSGHTAQFRVPLLPAGKFYMIKHGVWESNGGCPWAEQRRVFQIPIFNDYVNSDFTGTYNSPANGGAPSIQVVASDPTNPISNWELYYSTVDLPISSPNWILANRVSRFIPIHNHTFSNLQYGVYYKVSHISKHACSNLGYTNKKFYGNLQRMANNIKLEAIDSNTGTMTPEEYAAFEKMIQQELNTIQNPIKLYPNPATSVVNITKNTTIGEHKVTITNQYGKQMYEGVLSSELTLNVTGWRKGLYFVNVHTPDGIKVEKLLVE